MMTSVWPGLLAMWRRLWTIVTSCRFKTVPLKSDCLCTLALTLEVLLTWNQRQDVFLRLKVLNHLHYFCGAASDKELFPYQLRKFVSLSTSPCNEVAPMLEICQTFIFNEMVLNCWTALRTTQLFLQTLPVLLHQSCGIWASFTESTSPPLVWRFMSQTSMQNMPAFSLSGILHSSFFR